MYTAGKGSNVKHHYCCNEKYQFVLNLPQVPQSPGNCTYCLYNVWRNTLILYHYSYFANHFGFLEYNSCISHFSLETFITSSHQQNLIMHDHLNIKHYLTKYFVLWMTHEIVLFIARFSILCKSLSIIKHSSTINLPKNLRVQIPIQIQNKPRNLQYSEH